ncbi:MAG TPA: hypothetical protein VN372_00110 [Methanospirillum sp.]|nr:hypothetical protein [Methanospirillum sp.]
MSDQIITKPIYLLALFCLCGLISLISPASATIFQLDGAVIEETDLYALTNSSGESVNMSDPIIFFYDPDCGACAAAHEFINGYLAEHPDQEMSLVNIAEGEEQMRQFDDNKTRFNREGVSVPVLYIGPVALEGSGTIKTHTAETIAWYLSLQKKNS